MLYTNRMIEDNAHKEKDKFLSDQGYDFNYLDIKYACVFEEEICPQQKMCIFACNNTLCPYLSDDQQAYAHIFYQTFHRTITFTRLFKLAKAMNKDVRVFFGYTPEIPFAGPNCQSLMGQRLKHKLDQMGLLTIDYAAFTGIPKQTASYRMNKGHRDPEVFSAELERFNAHIQELKQLREGSRYFEVDLLDLLVD